MDSCLKLSASGEMINGETMEEASNDFFNEIQRKLAEMGLDANLSQDERDIVDDYEMQQFSVAACIEHLAKRHDYQVKCDGTNDQVETRTANAGKKEAATGK
jgi:hypothetical protein